MRRRITWAGALITTALAPGLYAGSAAAAISHEGIAGVKVGMTEAGVRAELGRPSSTASEDGAKRLDYRRGRLDVLLRNGQVIRVRTTSTIQKTASGVGPGTSQRAMMRKLQGEECGTARGARVCSVLRGKNALTFTCRSGKVTVAEVGRAES